MRTQALFRRSRSVLRTRPHTHSLTSCSIFAGGSRKPLHPTSALQSHGHVRNLSSTGSPPDHTPSPEDSEDPKPKPRGRAKRTQEKSENAALPPDLNILWSPDDAHTPLPSALPPPELFQEALNNLFITLHPQTQHRATYTQNGSPVEPTLALYCPIEGGEYIVDETVRELARRTRADIVVLDTIEIAAGEWGVFGKGIITHYIVYKTDCHTIAATAIQLPENPLHFPSSFASSSPSSSSPSAPVEQDADESDETQGGPHIFLSASQPFPFSQLGIPVSRSSRSNIVLSRRTQPSKAKAFFDDIVSMPSLTGSDTTREGSSSPSPPRIIYIRDYPTLAPSLSSWYPSLVASVRSRRQGPLARPTSPVINPTTIVFGITPPIVPPSPSPSVGSRSPSGLLRFLLTRQSPGVTNRRTDHNKPPDSWDESETAHNARERRLRERLRHWEDGDPSFYEELPESPFLHEHSSELPAPGTGIIIAGPSGQSFGSGILASRNSEAPKSNEDNSYFRLSVVVPRIRETILEKECRIARRRHINELVVRMAVGNVGGILSEQFIAPAQPVEPEPEISQAPGDSVQSMEPSHSSEATKERDMSVVSTVGNPVNGSRNMWEEWGQRVEVWTTVKEIADRAVGSVVASLADRNPDNIAGNGQSLDPTPIPWSAVQLAWDSQRNSRNTRRAWIEEASGRTTQHEEGERDAESAKTPELDEVIERVKQDPELDQHETRLLGCIVDSGELTQ